MTQSYTADQRNAFGQRLRAAREPMMKTGELASQTGHSSASTVTNWENGTNIPAPAVVFKVEQILGLAPGELSQHAGFLPVDTERPPCTIESAIAGDPDLDKGQRETVLRIVAQFKGSV